MPSTRYNSGTNSKQNPCQPPEHYHREAICRGTTHETGIYTDQDRFETMLALKDTVASWDF
jgi:hypothetical protein